MVQLNHWDVTATSLGIQITCRGHDRMRGAAAAVATFNRLAGEREGPFSVVADLREMTGYDTESRVVWAEGLRALRKRIDCVVFIGARSAMIRMGAAAVGAVSGIPVRFVHTWAEVPSALREG